MIDKSKLHIDTIVLSVELVDTSKVECHYIYEIKYLYKGLYQKQYIIEKNMIRALAKLYHFINYDIPPTVVNLILNSENLWDIDD